MAALVRTTHLSLPDVLLLVYLASLWATLFAFSLIAEQCFASRHARAGAVLLLALWLTIPVAGTSLILFDPYLTARSLSLPCTLFAFATLLRLSTVAGARQMGTPTPVSSLSPRAVGMLCASSLLFAALVHPLMAGYAFGATLLLACQLSVRIGVRRYGTLALCCTAVAAAALLHRASPPELAAYLAVALSRYYWFLSRWQWYELLGLAAPLAILSAAALRPHSTQPLARMAVAAGATSTLIALLFAHVHSATHLIARLQPLRVFQVVYVVLLLVLGGLLGDRLLRDRPWRWLAFTVISGAIAFGVQRATYPSSAHLEWPNAVPTNSYEQAFLWISLNTPVDALFALDAHYITAPGEDAQCFRALAERSILPDYSKDGGEASITPALTAAWTMAQKAQTDLNQRTDPERLAALKPFHVTWIVLKRDAKTAFTCPYRNARTQVCRLP